jgi:succinate-semialdehyde dehydrogenase/glutarate-semialdehyde dehydrogenase
MIELKDPSLLPGRCLVGGRWVSGTALIEVTNPATGAVIATV